MLQILLAHFALAFRRSVHLTSPCIFFISILLYKAVGFIWCLHILNARLMLKSVATLSHVVYCFAKFYVQQDYIAAGSTWMNSQCTKAYECMGNDNLITKDVTCGSKGYCSAVNKQYQCSCSTGSGTCKTAAQTIYDPNEYIICSC